MFRILSELLSTLLQLIILFFIPFVFFLFRKDKSISFFTWIGLTATTRKAVNYAITLSILFIAIGLGLIFIDDGIRQMVTVPPSVTGKLRSEESPAIAAILILIIALIKTSFSEEVFFRGFIGKRLINSLGFNVGNAAQALIFGLVHLLLFWSLMHAGPFALAFIFIFSTTAGWIVGIIKEQYGGGSILPGWIAHGLGNTVSYTVIVFLL